jgi:fatty acid desaturase
VSVPRHRRPLFWLLERAFPGLDRERIWRRLDMEAPQPGEVMLEKRLAELLRPYGRLVAVATLLFFVACVGAVFGLGPRLAAHLRAAGHGGGAVLIALAAGVLAHGLFALVVHEATHGNLFGHRADAWISNVALGALLLPFTAETYQHMHRLHHGLAMKVGDPNWTPFRQRLFQRSRLLYAIYELVPIVNNLDRLRTKSVRDWRRVVVSWVTALAVVALLRPGVSYVLLVYVGLNLTNAIRLWTEHFGFWQGRVSNIYWCPLGFGIGNHALHHENPRVPALALTLGLALRQTDASLLAAPYHVLFSPLYRPFRTFQPDFDGRNV